jgi:hypothetical protein
VTLEIVRIALSLDPALRSRRVDTARQSPRDWVHTTVAASGMMRNQGETL